MLCSRYRLITDLDPCKSCQHLHYLPSTHLYFSQIQMVDEDHARGQGPLGNNSSLSSESAVNDYDLDYVSCSSRYRLNYIWSFIILIWPADRLFLAYWHLPYTLKDPLQLGGKFDLFGNRVFQQAVFALCFENRYVEEGLMLCEFFQLICT